MYDLFNQVLKIFILHIFGIHYHVAKLPTHIAMILQEDSIGSPGGSSVSSHCTGSKPESSVSLEEAYQPSPISVLELPFTGEISSGSEYFGSVSDDICG